MSRGGFTARALTRDVNSDKAKELAKLGAEVVAADVDEAESLKRAFEGAYGAFCVTFFWEHFSPEKELAEADAMAQAAKHAGVQHVIWSTLEDTRKWVPLDDNRMPTLHGQVQGAALRRQGRGQSAVHRPRRADDVPADLVLLGQLHLLRDGPQEEGRTASWPSPCRWATRSCRASPPRTSASAPTASSREGASSSARPSASPAST